MSGGDLTLVDCGCILCPEGGVIWCEYHRERHARHEQMRRVGIRPPTRYEVTPEDLAPPVETNPRWLALLIRTLRWLNWRTRRLDRWAGRDPNRVNV